MKLRWEFQTEDCRQGLKLKALNELCWQFCKLKRKKNQ